MHNGRNINRAMVVVESMFGNTRAIAEAIAAELGPYVEHVDVVDVDDAPSMIEGVGLLVVGVPTHAFGMSRPSTRTGAREQGAHGTGGRGVREWLSALRFTPDQVPAAVFDTRIRRWFVPGSASRAMRRRLRRRGFHVEALERFTVVGTPGPLAEGELDRARRWASTLVDAAPRSVSHR